MEDVAAPNIQNEYFNRARREKIRVAVFLNNGRRLTGRIKSFDKFTVLLDSSHGEQIVFKHAIATVGRNPAAPGARSRSGFNNRIQMTGKSNRAETSRGEAPDATNRAAKTEPGA
ncbi:MAG: RNA chaperone Hfq [Acidobacteriota bacterium]